MKIIKTAIALAAAVFVIPAAGCTVSDDDPGGYGVGQDELTSSKTVGDWHLFGGGQCLVAVQNFYPKKFGVSVPIAGPGSVGNCASHGACKIWLDKIPSSADWERIPNDGHHMPTTYDLIVYPPISGDPWGHIASVDHVEGNNIFVMDSNYVGHEEKAPHPHTVGWKAYGWYHLKKLGGTPQVSCFPNGDYCGGDKVPGNHNWLYRCNSAGDGAHLEKECVGGCEVMSGRDDRCR
jgi:hypothetical protein